MERRSFLRLMAMAVPAVPVVSSALGNGSEPEEITEWSYDLERGLVVTVDNVRNVIDVEYGNESGVVRVTDPPSIARYGRRWMKAYMPELTEHGAREMAENLLADLHRPTVGRAA